MREGCKERKGVMIGRKIWVSLLWRMYMRGVTDVIGMRML